TALLKEPYDIEIQEVPTYEISEQEVLVKVMAVGVCGSDVQYYEHGRIGDFIVEKPIILGHECAGIIEEIGAEVKGFQKGDRVAIEPGVPCRECEYCKSGRYNLCSRVQFMATPPVDGALSQYVKYSPDFLYKIPDQLSYEEATLVEPL